MQRTIIPAILFQGLPISLYLFADRDKKANIPVYAETTNSSLAGANNSTTANDRRVIPQQSLNSSGNSIKDTFSKIAIICDIENPVKISEKRK